MISLPPRFPMTMAASITEQPNSHVHPQLKSSFLHLPAEIRNAIYKHALSTSEPIIDPSVKASGEEECVGSPSCSISSLAKALLLTCRLVNRELNIRLIFARNIFRFTSVTPMRNFLRAFPKSHSQLITDVEFDLGGLDARHPSVLREWARYLSWSEGSWTRNLGSLKMDVPNLRVLRFSLQTGQDIGTAGRDVGYTAEIAAACGRPEKGSCHWC